MYATVAQLADQINMTTPTTSQTEQLTRAIEAAGAQIDGLCGRSFASAPEIRLFSPLTSTILDIGYASVITSVDIDLDADFVYETNIPSNQYYITTEERAKRYISLRSNAANTFTIAPQTVAVSGTFGETAVPIEVELACLLQAARLWKRRDAIFGEIRGDNGMMSIPGEFDRDARALLKLGGWLKARGMVIV